MSNPRPAVVSMPSALPSGLTSKSRRQRRWSMALVGVLLILGSGLVFLLLFLSAGDRSPVLAVARDVPAGQVIGAGDLDVVRVGADSGVETIPESRRRDIIGQTAAVDLLPGTLLVEAQLGEPVSLATGDAVVGVDLVGGERAVPDLQEGDEVLVILTSPLTTEGGTDGEGAPDEENLGEVITEARVSVVTTSDDDPDRVVVSLIVPESDAEQVAGANAADRIALVLVPSQ